MLEYRTRNPMVVGASHHVVSTLGLFCQMWGGQLIEVDLAKFNRLFSYDAPNRHNHSQRKYKFEDAPAADMHGICWERKLVICVEGMANANCLIHEMGHVFACLDEPERAEEFEFLAWEVALARATGLYREWSMDNSSYGINPYADEWGIATAKQKSDAVLASYKLAIANGIIDPHNLQPKACR